MGDLGGRYAAHTTRLLTSVLATPGDTAEELRRAVLARAARLGGLTPWPPLPSGEGELDESPLSGTERGSGGEDVLAYVDKVARHAYRVTDEDVTALQRGGASDDALFEITVSAALGAALGRLDRGLRALRGVSSHRVTLSALVSSPPGPLSARRRGGTQE